MEWLRRPRWSPYLVGAAIGVLSWITALAMGHAVGVSTTFVRLSGAALGLVAPEHVQDNPYFAHYLVGKSAFDWQAALVVALFFGAWLSARLSRDVHTETVPDLWRERFGPSPARRALLAFVGGLVLLFGARLAGGCTSGHGISGGMRLAVSSYVFLIALFVGGVATALALFGRAPGKEIGDV